MLENSGLNTDTSVSTNDVSSEDASTTSTNSVENTLADSQVQSTGDKTFTQNELNEIIKDRLSRQSKSFYSKLGIEDENGLNDYINKVKDYDSMKELNNKYSLENQGLKQELLFLKNNILDTRKDDILTYFKGKNLDLNEDTLAEALSTHPEWVNKPNELANKETTIKQLASQEPHNKVVDEKQEAFKLFGL